MSDLIGLSVLVTRPATQAAGLAARIEQLGGEAVRYPVIEIQPPGDPTTLQNLPVTLQFADLAIFVSANAAEYACRQLLEAPATIPDSCMVAAVGTATARRLEHYSVQVDLVPRTSQDSAGLLELPELQLLTDASVVILRGEGGLPLLGDSLRERGATVTYCECYRRGLPVGDPHKLLKRWQIGGIDAITATSVATLDNLLRTLGEEGRPMALATPVVVVSDRVARHCDTLGWLAPIIVAAGASDEAVSQALLNWRASSR